MLIYRKRSSLFCNEMFHFFFSLFLSIFFPRKTDSDNIFDLYNIIVDNVTFVFSSLEEKIGSGLLTIFDEMVKPRLSENI